MSNLSKRRNVNSELDSDEDVEHTGESLNSVETQKGSKAVKENLRVVSVDEVVESEMVEPEVNIVSDKNNDANKPEKTQQSYANMGQKSSYEILAGKALIKRNNDHIMSNLSKRRNVNSELDSDEDVEHTGESLNSVETQKGSKAVKENLRVVDNKNKKYERSTKENDRQKTGESEEVSVDEVVESEMVEPQVNIVSDKNNDANKPEKTQQSYANMVKKKKNGIRIDNHPIYIAPNVNEEGIENVLALTSCLGKPLMMDEMTARMCQQGVGRTDYARVLVELEANKVMKSDIKIEYTDKDGKVKCLKMVNVMYDWKPELCSHCYVFGHSYEKCSNRPRTEEENKLQKEAEEKEKKNKEAKDRIEYEERQNRNRNGQQQKRNPQTQGYGSRQTYRMKNVETVNVRKDSDKAKAQNQNLVKTMGTDKGKGLEQDIGNNKYSALNSIMEGRVENTKPKSYDDEFPAFPISQNQNDKMDNGVTNGTTVEDVCSGKNGITSRMVENSDRENEILKKDDRMDDTLVDDKRIPNVEESKLWFKSIKASVLQEKMGSKMEKRMPHMRKRFLLLTGPHKMNIVEKLEGLWATAHLAIRSQGQGQHCTCSCNNYMEFGCWNFEYCAKFVADAVASLGHDGGRWITQGR
ncbi:hypothetical protein CTI12_AA494240 [Artemisia annua]|uniref:ATPase, F1/V1/A1 complex, alpha/beta subunit, Zinc knuckle CX2CX4HX4C n=1 Tax=Artemisia annua TaxID=35608 RepID=A0A2U1LG24_ARTAN|nr:hypothetical protein CTI12_AA494240 [Artemisia annua]